MKAVIESDERRMIDGVAEIRVVRILPDTYAAVVFHLQTQITHDGLLPEIETSRDFHIGEERRVLRVGGVERVVKIDEGEGVAPIIGIEEFHGRRHAVRTLVLANRIQTAEIIEDLQVCAGE